MKAFVLAVAALILVSVGAGVVLDTLNMSSQRVYQSDNVRVGH